MIINGAESHIYSDHKNIKLLQNLSHNKKRKAEKTLFCSIKCSRCVRTSNKRAAKQQIKVCIHNVIVFVCSSFIFCIKQ